VLLVSLNNNDTRVVCHGNIFGSYSCDILLTVVVDDHAVSDDVQPIGILR